MRGSAATGLGQPWLIVETDGSMVRTGELERDPAGGVSLGGRPKRVRKTQWREVRLSLGEVLGGGERQYAAAIGSPQRVGEQMFVLALRCGYGDNTWVHGVGDGAPWIGQQVAAVFPRQRFLLDRYHLLEHLHEGASALAPGDADTARAWVSAQAGRIDAGEVAGVVARMPWPGGRKGRASAVPVGRVFGEPARTAGLCHRPAGRSAHRQRRGGRRASLGDSRPVEIAGNMVEGGDGEPHAGLKVPAGQRPVGSLLELIPTTSKPIPRWDVHFGGLDDDRKDSTAPHITFKP